VVLTWPSLGTTAAQGSDTRRYDKPMLDASATILRTRNAESGARAHVLQQRHVFDTKATGQQPRASLARAVARMGGNTYHWLSKTCSSDGRVVGGSLDSTKQQQH